MYIQRIKYFGLLYKKNNNFTLVAYSYVDFARDFNDRTSTSCYLMNMGSTTVSWSCKKKATVANYSTEEEYISAWEATCEIV
jgi:hypothetical protein